MRSDSIWIPKGDSGNSKFYNAKTAKTGDTIVFKSDARTKEAVFDGVKKTLCEFDIEVKGKKMIYTINKTSFNAMEEAFGDTKNWVGKKASVFVAPTPKGDNKMILLDAVIEETPF